VYTASRKANKTNVQSTVELTAASRETYAEDQEPMEQMNTADRCSKASRFRNVAGFALAMVLLVCILTPSGSLADVPSGDERSATTYYRLLAKTLEFSTPEQIFQTTLDDLASYLGYNGFTGADFQNIPSAILMNPEQLLAHTAADNNVGILQRLDVVLASLGAIPIRPDDILVTRFFAPKIMNIREPESTRRIGWRKLVRLRARPGSPARKQHIAEGIILFNIFTQPGSAPFASNNESVNTQVMLITETGSVPAPNDDGPATIYWLDYQPLSTGGKLSLFLNATFDANELPQSTDQTRHYYVPDGCVACHGNNGQRSLVNYLDTDHWFDRLDTDFQTLKASGIPLLFDAGTNDNTAISFKLAFDVIRRFNSEADEAVRKAQPRHDEALASVKWLEVHATTNAHILPADRSIGQEPRWSSQDANDVKVLGAFNQYCFRCHGTVKFSVFNKQEIRKPEFQALIDQAIKADAPIGIRMPPDRDLPDDIRKLLLDFTQ
jgi:hypothetical protein